VNFTETLLRLLLPLGGSVLKFFLTPREVAYLMPYLQRGNAAWARSTQCALLPTFFQYC
jgi:hypothetical protein